MMHIYNFYLLLISSFWRPNKKNNYWVSILPLSKKKKFLGTPPLGAKCTTIVNTK